MPAPVSSGPRTLRALLRVVSAAALALFATQAFAQVPPYTIVPFSATEFTVHEGVAVTPVVRVFDSTGAPVQGWDVDWTVSGGSITAVTQTSVASPPAGLGGVASNTYSNATGGTYTIDATVDDAFIILKDPDGRVRPATVQGPVTFTVNVENVGLLAVDPPGAKDTILVGEVRALQVYWGGATLPKAGGNVSWSVIVAPGGSTPVLANPGGATDASGFTDIDFSADMAGDYTIRAANTDGCTFCGPTTQDFIITVVDPSADLVAGIADSPDPVAPDGTITYTITAGNLGTEMASTVTLTGAVPASTVFASLGTPPSWGCTTPAVGGTGTVTCNAASLAAGATETFTLVVNVTGNPAAGTIINNNINLSAITADPDGANNDASVDTTVAGVTAMVVVKVLTGTVDLDGSNDISLGDELAYDVTATNTGNVTLTSVVVSDDHYGGTTTCATLLPGNDCILNVLYYVQPADATAGEVVNTGTVTSDQLAPMTDSVTTPVAALPPALTIVSGDGSAGYGGQSALLVVQLLDGAGNPMVGETITWNGAGNSTSTTGTDGRSSNTVSFNGTSGFITVTAAYLPGNVEVQFSLQSISAGLFVISGNGQTGGTLTTLPQQLVVQATDDGSPIEGIPIAWTVESGDATLTNAEPSTDAAGEARVTVTFGATPGPVTIQAQRTDAGETAVFNVNATLTRTLLIHDGNNQSGPVGATLPLNLVVEAQDNGVGVDGVVINYSVLSGDATLGTCCATTAGGGFAGSSLTFGATTGPVQVRAERADDPSVFVVFTANAVQPTLTIVSGDDQTGVAGEQGAQALRVELRDGTPANNPIMNATITWTTVSGDAQPFAPTTLTGIDGTSSIAFSYGAPGPSVIRAQYGSQAVDFNVHAQARTLVITSGDGATLTVGDSVFHSLQVQSQLDGVPETSGGVNWVVTSGNATLTLANSPIDPGGFADTQIDSVTAPGPIVVTATHATDPSATVTFNLTAIGLPTLTVVSGNNQSGLVGTDADLPLVVVLRDFFGNPIPDAVVTWSSAVNGSVSSPSTLTDANGLAQVTLNYGLTPGSIQVFANTPSVSGSVAFSAQALAPALGIASGDGQVAPVNTTLPLPIVVQVGEVIASLSKAGRVGAQALAGVPVTFTITSGGGFVANTVVLTDAAGQASNQWTLGPIEGVQTVSASVPGGASITFTATATIARTLTLVSGNGQVAAPGSQLPLPLVVRAQDNGADAADVVIDWTVTGPATVAPGGPTDVQGLADATVTMGATPGAVTIRAERADDTSVFVTFTANTARLQAIPGLSPEELELAIIIDEACSALTAQSSLTPPQQDFLERCRELIDASIIDPGAVTDALDALMPGMALAMQESAFNAAQAQFQNLKARIAALRSGTQGSSFQGLALVGPGGSVSLGALGQALTQDEGTATQPTGEVGGGFQRWGFFASGTIGRGEAEAGSTRPAYDYDINGLTAGLDYRYNDRFIFGGALGYTRQDTELQGAPGEMEMSGWSVSGYATYYRDNSWYTDGVLTWGRNSFDLLRTITYTVPTPGGGSSTVSQTARSQSDGDMIEAAFTFGRDFQAGGWSIGPYGRLLYTKLDFDEIHDEMDPGAGSGLGMSIDARSLTSVASEVGAKFTYAHSTDWGVVTPHLQVEWEHEFRDDPKALTARFLADPTGAPFVLSGEEIDSDYFRMSVGLSIIMTKGRSGFLIYERTVGREGFDQANLGFGLRIEF